MIKKVLLAMDSFKGAVSSRLANDILKRQIEKHLAYLEVEALPIGDGGEGTMEALVYGLGGEILDIKCQNSQGELIDSRIGRYKDTFIVESAESIGLGNLSKEANAYEDSSYGFGQAIREALDLGAKKLILTLGGSATNDLGIGMLQALGVKFYRHGKIFNPRGAKDIGDIEGLDISGLDSRLAGISVIGLSDVNNPLYGPYGATAVYGKQKGIRDEDLEAIDRQVRKFSQLVYQEMGEDLSKQAMTGSAGGLGYAILTFLSADLKLGIDEVLKILSFEDRIKDKDLVVTGEGRIDDQSFYGKGPCQIGKMAKDQGKLSIAVTGDNRLLDFDYSSYFDLILDLARGPISLEESILRTEEFLSEAGKDLANIIKMANYQAF